MTHNAHILVVDDDTRLRDLLQQYLASDGFAVTVAEDAEMARYLLAKDSFDLVVLDVMMPGESGVELARYLRKEGNGVPILMLTARSETEDRIEGLESGADDYMTKPFEPKELSLRIENILKRSRGTKSAVVQFGDYRFHLERGELSKKGERVVSLSGKELTLLQLLAGKMDQVVTREELARALNGISERSVDVQVTRLRKKIEDNPSEPHYLQSVWGSGYVLRGGK